jgi:hypothetical protein
VAYFADAGEVYEYIGGVFETLIADPDLLERFRRIETVVQYRMRDPESTITVAAPLGAAPRVDYGETDLVPDLVMEMPADVAHRFWLGRVNVTVALARGQIVARGPVPKILKLIPLMKPTYPRYRARLEAAGRADLLDT